MKIGRTCLKQVENNHSTKRTPNIPASNDTSISYAYTHTTHYDGPSQNERRLKELDPLDSR